MLRTFLASTCLTHPSNSTMPTTWMCCVCFGTSRHRNSVQCEKCLANAHCTCAGFRTYAEAKTSNRLFFCDRCRPDGVLRPSPVATPPPASPADQHSTPPGSPSPHPPSSPDLFATQSQTPHQHPARQQYPQPLQQHPHQHQQRHQQHPRRRHGGVGRGWRRADLGLLSEL